ncbi:MAG: transglycosylase domain-containing protein, partial [Kangiellaceae bacterium]|nr:transglycosylase domain-containing protein [Kangiellaceae bacterium]
MSKKDKNSKKQSSSETTSLELRSLLLRLTAIFVVLLSALIIYSDAEIQQKFANNRWLVPAKIYTQPVNLTKPSGLTEQVFSQLLKQLNYQKKIKANVPGTYQKFSSEFVVYVRSFNFQGVLIPANRVKVSFINSTMQSNRLNNSHLNESEVAVLSQYPIYLEPLLIGEANPLFTESRDLIAIDKVPNTLIDALLVSEDRDFFDHWGVSLKGIARAVGANLSAGELKQGGSTITQQLVKNYFLTNKRSFWRKIREGVMALLLEAQYSKKEILEAYINEVYLGQDKGKSINGFATASRFYFGRDLTELNLAQTATLVAMVRGPSYYNPRKHPARVIKRRNLILQQLVTYDRITEAAQKSAQTKTLQVIDTAYSTNYSMPAVMGLVRRQLNQDYSKQQLNHDDLSVFTTIDPVIQLTTESAMSNRLDWLNRNYPSVPEDLQGAILVSDKFSGELRAIVGDRKVKYDGFNRAIDAFRQTGSAIKPFVYLTALERPASYSLISQLVDAEFSLTASDGSNWRPENYDKQQHGEVELQEALTYSYNLSTARLAIDLGIKNIVELLYRAGFSRTLQAFPSLALGAQEMSPYEVLSLYQVISSSGLSLSPSIIDSVIDKDGVPLNRYPITAEQV